MTLVEPSDWDVAARVNWGTSVDASIKARRSLISIVKAQFKMNCESCDFYLINE